MLLKKIENILNNRPITYVYDSEDAQIETSIQDTT